MGMLSRQRISRSQLAQEDGGRRSDLRAGTRAATTFKKLPRASAGARTKAAAATFTFGARSGEVAALLPRFYPA